ncbi:MAG: CvpA family protein [Bacillota bacterium]|nr:CvpA family protein [Bacillota bacterium]MDW7684279.1 CvpA family protein [Bacillota bacterium]
MSWVDLAALTLTLWSAAKGYVSGAYQALIHLFGVLTALVAAAFLQKPLTVYLNGEWQVREVFVGYLLQNVEPLQKTAGGAQQGIELPQLAGTVMRFLTPEAAIFPVSTQNPSYALVGEMLVKMLALFIFFLFIAMVLSFLLRIRQYSTSHKQIPEWQKLLGLVLGCVHGVFFSVILCVILDTISIVALSRFLQQDLSISYLSRIAANLVLFLPV